MMVNPDVDGYTVVKPQINRKCSETRELKPKYKPRGECGSYI